MAYEVKVLYQEVFRHEALHSHTALLNNNVKMVIVKSEAEASVCPGYSTVCVETSEPKTQTAAAVYHEAAFTNLFISYPWSSEMFLLYFCIFPFPCLNYIFSSALLHRLINKHPLITVLTCQHGLTI